jgi:general secretion pathway protein C
MNEWLARLPKNGPWLASAVLGVLIAVELARMGVALFGAGPVKSIAPISAAPTVAVTPAVDIGRVVAAHLFGSYTAAPGEGADPNAAPTTTANLQLAGTIATTDPKKGLAIIGDGGPAKVYSAGQQVGGFTLHSVYLDRVLLDRGGSLEALLLPHELPPGVQPAAYREPGSEGGTAGIVNNIRRMVAQDPGVLREIIRTVPSWDNKAGKLKGFRAYPGRSREAFLKLGLSPGDLVVAINGSPLDDPNHNQDLLNLIQNSSTATLTIEHLGQRKEVTLNVAQVAAQAQREIDPDVTDAPTSEPATPIPTPEEDPND